MATIQISELHPVGYDLLHDSASFLNELDTQEILTMVGGGYHKRRYSDYSDHSYRGDHSYSGHHSYKGDYSHYDRHYPRYRW